VIASLDSGLLQIQALFPDGDCVPRETLNNVKLILAASEGDVEAMEALIKYGADATERTFGTLIVAGSRNKL
jgi:hypothetical protein